MKDVQCYELFGGIALKNHAFSFSLLSTNEAVLWLTKQLLVLQFDRIQILPLLFFHSMVLLCASLKNVQGSNFVSGLRDIDDNIDSRRHERQYTLLYIYIYLCVCLCIICVC